ncbi:conserved protein, unknown function [Plasmodium vivax]|nr:conserved protein, unknown function [Plasmodium vivax]
MRCCGMGRGQECLLLLNRLVGGNGGMGRMCGMARLLSSLGGRPPSAGAAARGEEPAPKLGNAEERSERAAKQHPRVDPPTSVPSSQTDEDAVTKQIYHKVLLEHRLLRGGRSRSENRKKKNGEVVTSARGITSVDVQTSGVGEVGKAKLLSLVRSPSGGKTQNGEVVEVGEAGEVEGGRGFPRGDPPAGKKPDGLTPRRANHLTAPHKEASIPVDCTEEKNINSLLNMRKRNDITIWEKKKKDHFFKIFFSSKKVKIIKSQNHPIFIHLYKLATDGKYREKQGKILLTCKKMILEREQHHIARIYTNSINNLKDFRLFDNFILLSNRLLKRVALLYSFKNGVLAEVAHTFHCDDVGLPRLALCFCEVNRGGGGESGGRSDGGVGERHIGETRFSSGTTPPGAPTQLLCNGDVGTLIRSCFLLKWQCVFNVEGIGHTQRKKGKTSKGSPNGGNTDWPNVPTPRGATRKKPHINDIYSIDFFHPLTLRASAGHLLDIPYKKVAFTELHKYARENKILLLKYRAGGSEGRTGDGNQESLCEMGGDLYVHYRGGSHSEQGKPFLNLLGKAKGVFLLLDNCNSVEKEHPRVSRNYVHIGPSTDDSDDERIFDRVYYVNLVNNGETPLDVVAAYSILMYILKASFFQHIPQSCYVCAE